MSDDIIQQIVDCPMVKNIPAGVSILLKELSKEEIDIDELVEMLNKFPVICVRLVLVSNSVWAAPKVEITDVKQACLQLGLKMIKSISIALLVSQQFNTQKCKGFNERKFWLSSLVTADILQLMKRDGIDKSTAHLIGLVHNLGLMAIADIAPDKISKAILMSENSDQSFSLALQKNLGISYLQVTQIILLNWGLPDLISGAFYGNANPSIYRSLFIEASAIRNRLDLSSMPIELMDENDPYIDEIEKVIEKSAVYEELCSLYCR